MKYLITGGAGFIGSTIAHQLLQQNASVKIIDNFSTGSYTNLEPIIDKVELIEADIRDTDVVRRAVDGVDFVLHQAALPSVPRSISNPQLTIETNVLGTLNILQAARDADVKWLIYASSSSIYGDNQQLPKHENMCPPPRSPYAVSKLTGEQLCRNFWQLYGFETVALRYFNVFGPKQDPSSQYSAVIPLFITKSLRGEPVTVYGDGL